MVTEYNNAVLGLRYGSGFWKQTGRLKVPKHLEGY